MGIRIPKSRARCIKTNFGNTIWLLGVLLSMGVAEVANASWIESITSDQLMYSENSAIDKDGNILLATAYSGTADFDPSSSTSFIQTSGWDPYLVKLSPIGTFLWARVFNGSGSSYNESVASDSKGNVYVGGTFNGAIDLEMDGIEEFVASRGSYVVTFDSGGTMLRAFTLPGTGTSLMEGLALDSVDNLYVLGSFSGTLDFDPGPGVSEMTSFDAVDAYLMKLDSTGALVWTRRLDDAGTDGNQKKEVCLDTIGNIYTTGGFYQAMDFQAGPGETTLTARLLEVYITKHNSAGEFQWARQFGGDRWNAANDINVGPDGNIVATGHCEGSYLRFAPAPTQQLLGYQPVDDAYVLKLDPAGNLIWCRITARIASVRGHAWGTDVTMDEASNIYTCGNFTGTVDFDPGKGTSALIAQADDYDAYIYKLSPSGDYLGLNQATGPNRVLGHNILYGKDGSLYLSGEFDYFVEINPDQNPAYIYGGSGTDIYIANIEADSVGPVTGEGEGEGAGDDGVQSSWDRHSADYDGDYKISLSELLAVIQLFNTGATPGNTTQQYYCAPNDGDDNFTADPAISTDHSCRPHSADYNPQDWKINLSELLRMIQFYNTGQFAICAGGEDGYCADV